MGFHTPTLLNSILAVNSRWLARVLHTPSHLLTPQTLSTTSGDMRPFLDLIQQGFQSNFQYPSMQTTDDYFVWFNFAIDDPKGFCFGVPG